MADGSIDAFHAKAPRSERWSDCIVVLILSALVTVTVIVKIVQYEGCWIHDWDTGIYSNIVWNLITGDGFHSDVLRANDLGEHFSPIIAIFAPFFLFVP